VSCVGPIDLVAVDPDGSTHFIDVKTVAYKPDGRKLYRKPSEAQVEAGVRILYVDGDEFLWDTCVHKPKRTCTAEAG
jgi:hypothetical protein